MPDYYEHKCERDDWHSSPFYSGPGGYKLCLRVNPYGEGDGAGTHVSLYCVLMKGEHDDRLQWPFRGDITIQLVNQISDQYIIARRYWTLPMPRCDHHKGSPLMICSTSKVGLL